jgi:hypothetical protein
MIGNNANSSIAIDINAKACRSEGNREPNNTAAKIAALSDIGAVNLHMDDQRNSS